MADAGRAMMLYRGMYDSTYTYEKLDVVNHNGSLYISTTDGNLGTEPTDGTKWKLFLQGGVSDNIQATDTYGLVGTKGDSSFVQLLLDSLASRIQGVTLNRQTLGYSKKNLLKNTATTKTANGITFTVNEDGSVTVNGTATASAYFEMDANFVPIQNGKYILSGCPSGGSSTTFNLALYDNTILSTIVRDVGLSKDVELDITHTYKPTISVLSGTTVENLTFYPMIRSAEITDGTYEPYVDDVDTMLKDVETELGEIPNTYIPKKSILNSQEEIDANTSEENIAGALAVKSLKSNFANSIEALNSDLATKISSFEYKLSANSSIDIETSRGIYLLACKSNSGIHKSLHVMLFGDAVGTVEKIAGADDLYMTFSVENNVLTITNTHPNYLVMLYLVPLTR